MRACVSELRLFFQFYLFLICYLVPQLYFYFYLFISFFYCLGDVLELQSLIDMLSLTAAATAA